MKAPGAGDILNCDEEELLFRVLYPNMVKNGTIGFWVFANSSKDGMLSVDAERFRSEADELTFVDDDKGVAAFPCQACTENEQTVIYAPTSDNDAHCNVDGDKPDRVKKRLWAVARIVRPPPNLAY